jgi:hypothetical protein
MAAATGAIRVAPASTEIAVVTQSPDRHRRSLGLIIGLGITAVTIAAGITFVILDPFTLFVPAPGYSAQVEDALIVSIEAESSLGVTSVTCPAGLSAGLTSTFDCTVVFDDASRLEISATIADGGHTVQWSPAA